MKTIEVIDVINHGSLWSDKQIVKFYFPATIIMVGKIPHEGNETSFYKKEAFLVRQEELNRIGRFYPTTKKRLYDCTGNFLLTVVPAPCLVENSFYPGSTPLDAGFDNWTGTGTGPHNRPSVNFGVRFLLDQDFDHSLNKTQCAGKFKINNGIHYWTNDCSKVARRSQYFHINGQLVRKIAVCDYHISDSYSEGFGRVVPPTYLEDKSPSDYNH